MSWAKSIAVGLIIGVLISVLPFDLFAPCAVAPFIAVFLLKWGRELAGRRRLAVQATLSVAIAASMGAIATRLPSKYLDTRVTRPLPATCTTLAVAAKAAMVSTRDLAQDVLETQVCFSSLQPTLREVERVAGERGLALQAGWCGTGATLLWGMHPIRMKLTPLASLAP